MKISLFFVACLPLLALFVEAGVPVARPVARPIARPSPIKAPSPIRVPKPAPIKIAPVKPPTPVRIPKPIVAPIPKPRPAPVRVPKTKVPAPVKIPKTKVPAPVKTPKTKVPAPVKTPKTKVPAPVKTPKTKVPAPVKTPKVPTPVKTPKTPKTNPTAPKTNPTAPKTNPTGPVSKGATGIVAAAAKWKGTPYSFGGGSLDGPAKAPSGRGKDTTGFDCSSLARYAVKQATGKTLPRTADEQWKSKQCTHVPYAQRQAGDLVFWKEGAKIGHVGIVADKDNMWHAPHTGSVVKNAPIFGDIHTKSTNMVRMGQVARCS